MDLVGEVVSSILGEAVIEWLFPGLSREQPTPPEGEWKASLPSLAAFLAGVAALFCGLSAVGVLRGMTDLLLWAFLGGAVMLAILSSVLAHRALEVTGRRRGLAKTGLWLSRATIFFGLLTAVLSVTGITVPL